jgi:long-chain acyl-CoA synthetase
LRRGALFCGLDRRSSAENLGHRNSVTCAKGPVSVVTLKAATSVSKADLRAFVAERLAAFKVPVKIVFSLDLLPGNLARKPMKHVLKRLFADARK